MRRIADMDDWKLLRCFVETGSQEAFTQLVNCHMNLVYSVCLRETRDPILAQDVTQAVFLTLFHKAPTIRKGTILAGWLFNTSRFAAKNAIRQESRRKAMEQELIEATSHSAQHHDAWHSIEPLLHDAITSLGAKEREAILLRYFEDKSLKEVGLTLGTTENAAQMRVLRAVEKMKLFLQRNGVAVPVAVISTLLTQHAVQAAPASCAQAIGHLFLGAATGTTAVSASMTATKAYSISQGVIKSMFLTKLKVASMVAACSVIGVIGVSYVSHLVPTKAARADVPTLTGSAVLQRSKAAYAALSSYVGTTSVQGDYVMDGKATQYNGTANIDFTRPKGLNIDGQLAGGGTYLLASNGQSTRVETVAYGKKRVQNYSSVELGVAALTGVAAQSPTMIPAALMNFNWGNPFGGSKNARLEGQEIIDGARCYKVSLDAPHDKKTYWIDVKSSLMRRYRQEQDQIDMAKINQALTKAQQKLVKFPQSMSSTTLHNFTVVSFS